MMNIIDECSAKTLNITKSSRFEQLASQRKKTTNTKDTQNY